jgi:predicted RND superfamily exporter protein
LIFALFISPYFFSKEKEPLPTFAAFTPLIGAGALLFSSHPIFFSGGVKLVTGVLSGYLSSLIAIPPLHRLGIKQLNVS